MTSGHNNILWSRLYKQDNTPIKKPMWNVMYKAFFQLLAKEVGNLLFTIFETSVSVKL